GQSLALRAGIERAILTLSQWNRRGRSHCAYSRVPSALPSGIMATTKNPFSLSASTEPDRLAEIYRAAASIICEKGYDATSMNDIAEAVGITKSGLYHHVSGKRNLLFSIMSFGLDSLEEQVIIPARAVTDAEQRLRTIITSHVHLITSR